MTVKEFEHYNNFGIMPRGWIGQGYGYKATWNIEHPDDIIYIPESAYEEYDDCITVPRKNETYSTNDFINLCNGDVHKAEYLFNYCDWQFPDGAMDECFEQCYTSVTKAFKGYSFMDSLINEQAVTETEINTCYTLREILDSYLTYEGIIGYTDRIINVINTYNDVKGDPII